MEKTLRGNFKIDIDSNFGINIFDDNDNSVFWAKITDNGWHYSEYDKEGENIYFRDHTGLIEDCRPAVSLTQEEYDKVKHLL